MRGYVQYAKYCDSAKKVNPDYIPPATHHIVYEKPIPPYNDTVVEKRIAREILNMIETVYFGEQYRDYRVRFGSNGQRDLIIQMIQDKYGVA